ncbi:MAG TPA: hypothetical protein PKD09_04875 [Aggregatilinea sp.]|uniref:hypothetical protein n=1 Tax=Aggregatilinea sp. TaxID=2806333 RepID=UPI002BECADC4|nr:hypothetical protein [Aggregatilinea sp.]HML20958.1 hypothetical protein [Aggregatilinea sp.]
MIEDFRRQFFPNTEPHTLTLEITSDDWAALCQIIEENEWERDEGLRYILAAGRAYLQTSAEMAHPDDPEADRVPEPQKSQREMIDMRGQLAVMKYRAFHYMQAVRILEMKLNASEVETDLLRKANEKLRQKLSEQQR